MVNEEGKTITKEQTGDFIPLAGNMATPRECCHTLPQAPERRGPNLEGGGNSRTDRAAKVAALQTAAILLATPKMVTHVARMSSLH